jgi:hypothetical protein
LAATAAAPWCALATTFLFSCAVCAISIFCGHPRKSALRLPCTVVTRLVSMLDAAQ